MLTRSVNICLDAVISFHFSKKVEEHDICLSRLISQYTQLQHWSITSNTIESKDNIIDFSTREFVLSNRQIHSVL